MSEKIICGLWLVAVACKCLSSNLSGSEGDGPSFSRLMLALPLSQMKTERRRPVVVANSMKHSRTLICDCCIRLHTNYYDQLMRKKLNISSQRPKYRVPPQQLGRSWRLLALRIRLVALGMLGFIIYIQLLRIFQVHAHG